MEREINRLIEECICFFNENHYVKERIRDYRSLWNRGIVRYMEKKITNYRVEVGRGFIEECFPEDDLSSTAKEMIRCIRILDDALNQGNIR